MNLAGNFGITVWPSVGVVPRLITLVEHVMSGRNAAVKRYAEPLFHFGSSLSMRSGKTYSSLLVFDVSGPPLQPALRTDNWPIGSVKTTLSLCDGESTWRGDIHATMSSLSIADMNTVVKMLIGHDRAGSLDLAEEGEGGDGKLVLTWKGGGHKDVSLKIALERQPTTKEVFQEYMTTLIKQGQGTAAEVTWMEKEVESARMDANQALEALQLEVGVMCEEKRDMMMRARALRSRKKERLSSLRARLSQASQEYLDF